MTVILSLTLIFAACCALVNLWLAIRIGRMRVKENIMHGDGGNVMLLHRMRAQSNFVEYTPIVLILFALVELARGPGVWLAGTAAIYVVARIFHGIGMDPDKPGPARMIGTAGTYLVTIGLVIAALYAGYAELAAHGLRHVSIA